MNPVASFPPETTPVPSASDRPVDLTHGAIGRSEFVHGHHGRTISERSRMTYPARRGISRRRPPTFGGCRDHFGNYCPDNAGYDAGTRAARRLPSGAEGASDGY